jgi:putative hydrolase of the HAD superfamily
MKKVILCDLGGVLINLHWTQHAGSLLGKELTKPELRQIWFDLYSARHFEQGLTDFETFYKEFCEETKSNFSFEFFSQEFDGIIGTLKDDCLELLKEIKKYGTLALLSNSNERHIAEISKTGLFQDFDYLFFSHKLHMTKPEYIIFEETKKQLGCEASNIYFFDDSQCNVDAAKKVGFNAFLVESPREILKIVKEL